MMLMRLYIQFAEAKVEMKLSNITKFFVRILVQKSGGASIGLRLLYS